jgi:hypothetical protein
VSTFTNTAAPLRLARSGVTALVVLLIMAIVAAFVAFQQCATAQSERDTAIFNQITAYRMRPTTPVLYTDLLTDANAALSTPLTDHTNSVLKVAFSLDGRTLATGSIDQTVRLWGMNVDRAIQLICATTANTLTPAMWAAVRVAGSALPSVVPVRLSSGVREFGPADKPANACPQRSTDHGGAAQHEPVRQADSRRELLQLSGAAPEWASAVPRNTRRVAAPARCAPQFHAKWSSP